MSLRPPPSPGNLHSTIVDQELAHIRRVMPLSLQGDLAGPIFPAAYWRRRLVQLLDAGQVSKGQLSQIDSLLAQIDEFEQRMKTDAPPGAPDSSGEA